MDDGSTIMQMQMLSITHRPAHVNADLSAATVAGVLAGFCRPGPTSPPLTVRVIRHQGRFIGRRAMAETLVLLTGSQRTGLWMGPALRLQ